jgi:hypothetical protein
MFIIINIILIGNSTFYGCTGLTSVTLTNGLTKIGLAMFAVSGLKTVIIPSSVAFIGKI